MHIFLAGPPGVGKSTVAPVLARILGATAVDLDGLLERRAGAPCRTIIERDGMPRFRELEAAELERLGPTPAMIVVALGGGAVIRDASRTFMRSRGVIVGLRGSLATVTRGIAATAERRPSGESPREMARRVLRERASVYRDADASFDVDGAGAEEVARAVAAWLLTSRGIGIDVHAGSSAYSVLIRAGLHDDAGALLSGLGWTERAAIVCDATGARLYARRVEQSLRRAGIEPSVIRVPTGERAKSTSSLRRLWSALADAKLGRDGGIVALGGGAVGDLAGFAAATYLRGVRLAHLPTTLLAMVDSSIGGKTGIDLPEGKNLAGAFHQPDVVLSDPNALATLPRRQVSSGLAEVVKTAFLADRASVAQVRAGAAQTLDGDLGPTVALIALAAVVKAGVVGQDERENGLRALLNYGHTMGHAYEAASGYRVAHGEAVSIGMVFATALAVELGLARPAMLAEVEDLLARAQLPRRARIPAAAWKLLALDKKVRAGRVRWILPRRVGSFSEVTDVRDAALRRAAAVVEGK